jgi:hypothetical protein
MVERVKAWQCIGCGRIEAPQTCVGVCDFNRIEIVYGFEHEKALEGERSHAAAFEALARSLATITPREGEWERSYRALQEQARRLLAEGEAAAAAGRTAR